MAVPYLQFEGQSYEWCRPVSQWTHLNLFTVAVGREEGGGEGQKKGDEREKGERGKGGRRREKGRRR